MSGSQSQILQEFLVAIKYEESGREKFVSDLSGIAKGVLKFASEIEAAAAAAVLAVAKIAASFEDLYFASQRIGSSVENIRAMTFAVSQMGGSADGARQALEGLGRFLRSNPGSESFLNSLGVNTRSGGKLRDTSAMLGDLAEQWKHMPFFQAQAQASVFGIDERTLLALMQDTGQFAEQLKEMYRAAGVDSNKAAEGSRGFMVELRLLIAAFGVLRDRVMTDIAGKLTAGMQRFRTAVVSHFGDISKAITWFMGQLLVAADVVTQFVVRGVQGAGELLKWWNSLGEGGKFLVETLAALAAGVALIASPAAAVAAFAASILLLFDDYQTWKEGGQSLIDWAKWEPSITAAKKAIEQLGTGFLNLFHELFDNLHGPDGQSILSWFQEKLPKAIMFGADAITKHLFPAILALVHIGAAMEKGDWHGMLKASAELNAATGIGSNNDPPTEEERKQGEGEGTTVIGRFWRRHAPVWAGGTDFGAVNNEVSNPNRNPQREEQSTIEAYQFWREKGLDDNGARAMVAQMIKESGGDPGARGDGLRGHGLFQHHEDRRKNILHETGINMSTANFRDQLEGTYQEMSRGLDAGAGAAWKILNDPQANRYDKVRAATKLMERPKDANGDEVSNRLAIANRLNNLDQPTSPAVGAAPPSPPSSVPVTASPNQPANRTPSPPAKKGAAEDSQPSTLFQWPPPGFRDDPASGGGRIHSIPTPVGSLGTSSNTTTNSPTFAQNVTIHVNGGGNDVAEQVQVGLRNANQNAIRNLSTAVT